MKKLLLPILMLTFYLNVFARNFKTENGLLIVTENAFYYDGIISSNELFSTSRSECLLSVDLKITDEITPVFNQIGPLCQYSIAPPLPNISVNGIKGTWGPSQITTSASGTYSYTFHPDAGQGAVPTSMYVDILPAVTPVFNQLGPFCQNSIAPALPDVSLNGITGKWSPAVINTSIVRIQTITFTPDPGQCASIVIIDVEIDTGLLPLSVFITVYGMEICEGEAVTFTATPVNGGTNPFYEWFVNGVAVPGETSANFTHTPKNKDKVFATLKSDMVCVVERTDTSNVIAVNVGDTIPPIAICRNINVYLDTDGKASITTAQINNGSIDDCKLDTLFLSRYNFDCTDVGKNQVTFTAVDEVGLRDFCVATVTVFDTIKPAVVCKGPFSVWLDNVKTKFTVDDILEDAYGVCRIDTIYVDQYQLDCDHIGRTPITLTAIDVNGNKSYCSTDVTILGNFAPTIVEDRITTAMNVPIVIHEINNDFDEKTSIDISTLALTIKPLHGTVSINPINGDFTYTPDRNFNGTDVLQYRICDDGIPCEPECGKAFVYITVKPVNVKPVAVDDYYNIGWFSIIRNVIENDYETDSDNMTIDTNPLYPPNHGQLTIYPDGLFNYIPNEGYTGIDSFAYVIWDNGIPSLSDTATVYIQVTTGVEPNPLNKIDYNIFPNPNDGNFNIEIIGATNKDIYVDVFNSAGSVIKAFQFEQTAGFIKENINLQGIACGKYYLRLKSGNKIITKEIFVH